jgi:hypothetical protein
MTDNEISDSGGDNMPLVELRWPELELPESGNCFCGYRRSRSFSGETTDVSPVDVRLISVPLSAPISVRSRLEALTVALRGISSKTLVVADVSDAKPRFRQLDTTRACAIETLDESGERERISNKRWRTTWPLIMERMSFASGPTCECRRAYSFRAFCGCRGFQIRRCALPRRAL